MPSRMEGVVRLLESILKVEAKMLPRVEKFMLTATPEIVDGERRYVWDCDGTLLGQAIWVGCRTGETATQVLDRLAAQVIREALEPM